MPGQPANTTVSQEEKELLDSLGVGDLLHDASIWPETDERPKVHPAVIGAMHPAVVGALAVGFVANLGLLLSLPPVIMSKGAPYLPTFSRISSIMWKRIRENPNVSAKVRQGKPLTFVDLGSGDGRLVFQAARQGIFAKSIGYEINPVLHTFAFSRRLLQAPKYWTSTSFLLRDLWKVELENVDVVAVYGLQPIMGKLGNKLQADLKDGSVVVSNVFSIPGWRPSGGSEGGVFIYSVPDCWEKASSSDRPMNE